MAASRFCLHNKTVHCSSSDNCSCLCGYRGGHVTQIQKITTSQPLHDSDGYSRWERDPRKAGQNLTHLDTSCCLASAKLWSWISGPRKACVGGGNEANMTRGAKWITRRKARVSSPWSPGSPCSFSSKSPFIARASLNQASISYNSKWSHWTNKEKAVPIQRDWLSL